MTTYAERLEKVQNSPSSRVARSQNTLNFDTLETDTVYSIVYTNPQTGLPAFLRIEAKTIMMTLPKGTIK